MKIGELMKKLSYIFEDIKNNKLKQSMVLSTICKPLGMIVSLIYMPVLLNYLGEESYGIWSTILSIINWINYFDVGIGQGLRNSLAKSFGLGDKEAANESVSTGYVILSKVSFVTFLAGTVLILVLNINAVFNTDILVRPALLVSFICICINFVLSLSKTLLYATQQAEKVSLMALLTQLLNLVGITVVSVFSRENLLAVAIVVGLSGIIVNLVFTFSIWENFNFLIPRKSLYRASELKNICTVGIKFFIIQIAALVLYTTDNMIITQLFGPVYVTPYHTVYAAFGIVNGLFAAMIAPIWSKCTVEKEKGNYIWIKRAVFSLDRLLVPIGIILIIGTVFFEPISRVWLRKDLEYDSGLIKCMAFYYLLMAWGSIYSNIANGMEKINVQLISSVVVAILNIPLSILLGKFYGMGTTGVCLATCLCMIISNISITINIHHYLDRLIK